MEYLQAPVIREVWSDSDSDNSDEDLVKGLNYWALSGPGGDREATVRTTMQVCDLETAVAMLAQIGNGLDIVEFCGGEGRATKIAIRRRLRTGRNFDLVTNADLGKPSDQKFAVK